MTAIFKLANNSPILKLSDVKLIHGEAHFLDGSKFSGIIQDVLKNGDVVELSYKNGRIQKSIVKGLISTVKQYFYKSTKQGISKAVRKINSNGKLEITQISSFPNGKLKKVIFDDKSFKEFYPNGQIAYEKKPTGAIKKWFENGKIKVKFSPNGESEVWHDNGLKKSESLLNGVYREWYDNGQLKKERFPNGMFNHYFDNGQLKAQRTQEQGVKMWTRDGRLHYQPKK